MPLLAGADPHDTGLIRPIKRNSAGTGAWLARNSSVARTSCIARANVARNTRSRHKSWSRKVRSWNLIWIAALQGPVNGLAAQRLQTLDRPTCGTCRVDTTRLTTLGADSLDGFLTSYPLWVSMDQQSRIYVGLQPPGDLLLTFDTTGRFLGRVGRKGTGPAEFTFPVAAISRSNGDLLVWDFRQSTLTTLDRQFRHLRRVHQPSPPVALLPDGHQLVVAARADRQGVGYPLHIYDDSGRRVNSFGAVGRYDASEEWRLMRTVTVDRDGSIWSASQDEYRIEQWTSQLEHARTLARTVPWMPRVTVRSDGVTGVEPNAMIVALSVDRERRLWVYSRVAAERWREALGTPVLRPGRPNAYPRRDRGRLYDTMVDVIDLNSGSLLVSNRLRMHVRFVLRSDLVASYREDANAIPLLDIVRVRLLTEGRVDR